MWEAIKPLRHSLSHEEGCPNIQVHHCIEVWQGHLLHGHGAVRACVVHQDIERAMGADQGGRALGLKHIHDERLCPASGFPDGSHCALQLVYRAGRQGYVSARLRQSSGCGQAKAAASPGDQRRQVIQTEGWCLREGHGADVARVASSIARGLHGAAVAYLTMTIAPHAHIRLLAMTHKALQGTQTRTVAADLR